MKKLFISISNPFKINVKLGYCPSCNRFVGIPEECPFCSSDCYIPAGILFLKRWLIILAFLSISFLYIASMYTESSTINRNLNYSKIAVSNKTLDKPCVNEKDYHHLNLIPEDTTGKIETRIYEEKISDFIKKRESSQIRTIGTLVYKVSDYPPLILKTTEER